MATLAQCDPITQVEPQGREFGPRLDMVSVEPAAANAAFLAGVIVALEYRRSPSLVLVSSLSRFSRGLIALVLGMRIAASELCRRLPFGAIRAATNCALPFGTQFGIVHLFTGLLASALSPLWRASIGIHGGNGACSLSNRSGAGSKRIAKVLFPCRRVVGALARAIRGRLSDAYAVVVIRLANLERLTALRTRHRDAALNRTVLAVTRTGLAASMFQPRGVNHEHRTADLARSLYLRQTASLLRSSSMGQLYQLGAAD